MRSWTAVLDPIRDGMVRHTSPYRSGGPKRWLSSAREPPAGLPGLPTMGGECPLQDIPHGLGDRQDPVPRSERGTPEAAGDSPSWWQSNRAVHPRYRCVRFRPRSGGGRADPVIDRGTRPRRPLRERHIAPFHGKKHITELCPVGADFPKPIGSGRAPGTSRRGSICTLCPSQCPSSHRPRRAGAAGPGPRQSGRTTVALTTRGRFACQMSTRRPDPRRWSGARRRPPHARSPGPRPSPRSRGIRGAGENAAALVGGGTSNEGGWLVQASCGRRCIEVDSSARPIEPRCSADVQAGAWIADCRPRDC